jgi:TonB family protein
MAAPLRSANPGQQKSMQFAHFGVLDAGHQSKTSTMTSLLINLAIGFVIIVLSLAHKQIIENTKLLTNLVVPVEQKKPEPPKPKITPPKPKPLPQLAKVEEPKIIVPVKMPELPKQPIVKMDQPKPILVPAAPKRIIAMAAPVAVSLAHPQAASVPNNDPHPSAVRLGASDSPVNNLHGPSVAPVNLARGMPGMNAGNTGNGPPATKVVLGNGSPESTTIKGNGVVAAVGIPHGVPGGTGSGPAHAAGPVSLGQATPPPMPKATVLTAASKGSPAKVTAKPRPEYTQEARQLHIEGTVVLRIRVLPDASVEVLSVISGLGHGLDESAKRAIMATKFEPATDATGHPIAWDGIVNVAFQLAG